MFKNLLPSVRRKNGKALRQAQETPFLPLQREMNKIFDDFFNDFGLSPFSGFRTLGFEPNIDVCEDDKELKVKAELPGLEEKDIEVDLTPDALTIRGEKKDDREEKSDGYWYKESRYGSFHRVVPLPEGIDQQKAEAQFKNGVLTVTLPWMEGSKVGKKIAIKTA
ncbi:MAG TPA: Hsp20/alpha crystallin family protein [Smithellaceae bacterium]|nr:Hsp20/alpha crystallin family protein [Smithellaceae bacterium]HRS89463.1 Hsp20/alpha crystallin family protein [Smithellaceae bacterium]HRV26412.1 Hsp20/alpha crystallin family protein [Smithellaceae bacterium]